MSREFGSLTLTCLMHPGHPRALNVNNILLDFTNSLLQGNRDLGAQKPARLCAMIACSPSALNMNMHNSNTKRCLQQQHNTLLSRPCAEERAHLPTRVSWRWSVHGQREPNHASLEFVAFRFIFHEATVQKDKGYSMLSLRNLPMLV